MPYVADVRPVKTNILIFDVKEPWTAESFLANLAEHDIKAVAFGPQTVRFVTHLDFTEEMMGKVLEVLRGL
jgi:threonine aldolase